jgi:hypothetical protein
MTVKRLAFNADSECVLLCFIEPEVGRLSIIIRIPPEAVTLKGCLSSFSSIAVAYCDVGAEDIHWMLVHVVFYFQPSRANIGISLDK